jgi:hypothetical protein
MPGSSAVEDWCSAASLLGNWIHSLPLKASSDLLRYLHPLLAFRSLFWTNLSPPNRSLSPRRCAPLTGYFHSHRETRQHEGSLRNRLPGSLRCGCPLHRLGPSSFIGVSKLEAQHRQYVCLRNEDPALPCSKLSLRL